MQEADEQSQPVKTKAVLIDARSTVVLWMNEAATQDAPSGDSSVGLPVAEALPIVTTLGLPEALTEAAATGVPHHSRTALVSTSQGSLAIAASVYRVLDDKLLVLIENAWQPGRAKSDAPTSRGPRRKSR